MSVLVTVRSADLDLLAERGIDADMIVDYINRVAGDRDLQKVVVAATDSDPVLFIEYLTDTSGVVHKPGLSELQGHVGRVSPPVD